MTQLQKVGNKPIALRHGKSYVGRTTGHDREVKKIDDTQVALFGRLIYETCKDGKVLTRLQIAKIVSRILDGAEVREHMAGAWISRVREFLIHEYNETFIYVNGYGYKLAAGVERVAQVSKIGHMALKWKRRFQMTASILTAKELADARTLLIQRLQKDDKIVSDQFLLDWKDNAKLLNREVKDIHVKLLNK